MAGACQGWDTGSRLWFFLLRATETFPNEMLLSAYEVLAVEPSN